MATDMNPKGATEWLIRDAFALLPLYYEFYGGRNEKSALAERSVRWAVSHATLSLRDARKDRKRMVAEERCVGCYAHLPSLAASGLTALVVEARRIGATA